MLPLDNVRQILSYHPWHWWQLSDTTYTPIVADCDDIIYEYGWQNAGRLGRSELRTSIETAEQLIHDHVGYWPAPRYGQATVKWPATASIAGSDGHYMPIRLPDHHVLAVGSEVVTLLGDADVIYSDEDGDGLEETFTVTFATSVAADELFICFASLDRINDDGDINKWSITPVSVSVSSGVVVFAGPKWLLVKPKKYQGVMRTPLNPTTIGNFVTEVSVYRRHTDMDTQATLIWEALPYPSWCSTPVTTTDPSAIATATARASIRNGRLGIVGVGQAQQSDGAWIGTGWWEQCRPPDRVIVNYLSGIPLVRGQMDHAWQLSTTYLAVTRTTRELCGCRGAAQQWRYLQQDLARTSSDAGEIFAVIASSDLKNPFGTRRGAILAWKHISHQRLFGGIAI